MEETCSRSIIAQKAKRIRFYCNGDQFFKGVLVAVSHEKFRSLKSLIDHCNRTLKNTASLPLGVRYIFALDGTPISSVEELVDETGYVCSSTEAFKRMDYEKARQPLWSMATAKSARRDITRPTIRRSGALKEANDFVTPRIIVVIRNGVKPRKAFSLLLNKKTAQTFEQVMQDITGLVKLDSGIVRRVYTITDKPVTNLADFFNDDRVFIAYGTERKTVDDFFVDDDEWSYFSPKIRQICCAKPRTMPTRNDSIRISHRVNFSKDKQELPILPSELSGTFDILRVLGDGNTAIVYEVRCRESQQSKALKVIDRENSDQVKRFVNTELALMKKLDNPFVVKMFDNWIIDESFFIALELVPDGDLFECLKVKKVFTEEETTSLMHCLATALQYVHKMNIVHRDVKPENLLVFSDPLTHWPQLKLADFGLAATVNDTDLLYDICGTPTYVAPEVLANEGYHVQVDNWSAGIILYVLLCGFPPFMQPENSHEALFDAISRGVFTFPMPYWKDISFSSMSLVHGLLTLDVDKRLTAEEMLHHHWLMSRGRPHPQEEFLAMTAVKRRLREEEEVNGHNAEADNVRHSMEELRSPSCVLEERSNSFAEETHHG